MNDCDPLFDGSNPIDRVLDPSLYAPCETCGMLTHPGFKVPHECPEPFPYETARYLASVLSYSSEPIHPRLHAQIKMGLESQPPPVWVDWGAVVNRDLAEAQDDRVRLLGLDPEELPRFCAALEEVSIGKLMVSHDSCEVCGAGPHGRCDPLDDLDDECPHGCSPER